MPLTQTQLASEVADRSGLTKSDAKAALAALEEVVLEQLADAEKVRIGGVVQLVVRVKEATKPRQGRNPATGEEITISALAVRVRDLSGSTSAIKLVPYDEAYESGFEDMPRRVPDLTKISKMIGYKTQHTLDDILTQVIDYFRKK